MLYTKNNMRQLRGRGLPDEIPIPSAAGVGSNSLMIKTRRWNG